MTITFFYLLSLLTIIIALGAIYITMIDFFPIKWTYYHYHFRKPINWLILLILFLWTTSIISQTNTFPFWTIIPISISAIGLLLTHKLHQEVFFKAINFPKMTTDFRKSPMKDDMELALIEYDGITKCYPLDYLIHHHILNDKFNTKIVSLTYCAMCRSVIPFDVTKIGTLFVGSFKGANMIVADTKTKTFFQQATFQSIIGKLHPMELKMIPFQVLTWKKIKKMNPKPKVSVVTNQDFRKFELPVPGIWQKLIKSEKTPGISSKNKDNSFPARTRVIGIRNASLNNEIVYLKTDVLAKKIVRNTKYHFILIAINSTILGFKTDLQLVYKKNTLIDKLSKTKWTINGKYIKGKLNKNLKLISISDEYWFSWKKYHPKSKLIRLN